MASSISSTFGIRCPWTCKRAAEFHLLKPQIHHQHQHPHHRGRLVVTRASDASTALFAKEMERVSAKEALLLSIADAGGFESAAFGKENDAKVIDIYEKVLLLERLNPTPRPTTSPLLDGLWKFEWAGATSPAILSSKFLLKNLPSALLSSSRFTLGITDGTAKATFNFKAFGSIETSFVLTTSLSVEGPSRLRERYIDGVLAPPNVREGSVPPQIQGFYDQFLASVQRLPEPIRESFSSGLKISLGGSFERLLLVSFLDEEILIARDISGAPDVLSRLESKSPVSADPVVPEYQS